MGIEIKMLQPIKKGYEDCLFYGGDLAEIVIDEDKSLLISVCGDVRATLYDENDDEIAFVKDKNNCGRFYGEMKDFVNESNIYDYIENFDTNAEKVMSLQLTDNNWVEVNGLYKGHFIEFELLDNILDSLRVDDAIEEVCVSLDDWVDQLEEKIRED